MRSRRPWLSAMGRDSRLTLPDASASAIFRSSCSTTSAEALPPYSGLYLKPFHSGGLWLAVMTTPPAASRETTL